MVEGDEKSKHIFSQGGWVQTTQQAKELVISVFQKPKLTIQKRLMLSDFEYSRGDKPFELPLINFLDDLISFVFYFTSLSWPKVHTLEIEYPTWQVIQAPDMPLVGAMSFHVSTVIEIMIQCSNFCDANLIILWWGNGLMLELKWLKQKGSLYFWAKVTNNVEDDLQDMLWQT